MHWQFGEMEFGEMKRNTSNWSNFGMLLRRAGLTASAGLSCFAYYCSQHCPILHSAVYAVGLINELRTNDFFDLYNISCCSRVSA